MEEPICVYDFNGYQSPGHFPISMWADYWPNSGTVTFGGDWSDIPDWVVLEQPSSEEVEQYAQAIIDRAREDWTMQRFRRILSICMYQNCLKLLGSYTEPAQGPHPGVSHGVCSSCQRIHWPARSNARKEG